MATRIFIIVFGFVFILSAVACTTAKSTSTELTYTRDIKPIVDMHCANSCHNAEKPAGKIDLTTYANVKQQSLEGKLLLAIQQVDGAKPMPRKAPKLEDDAINKIITWANSGAKE